MHRFAAAVDHSKPVPVNANPPALWQHEQIWPPLTRQDAAQRWLKAHKVMIFRLSNSHRMIWLLNNGVYSSIVLPSVSTQWHTVDH
jgi:hypothetical protein